MKRRFWENSSKVPFFADFGHLNTVSNKSSSCEIEEMSFNISNLSIFRPSTSYKSAKKTLMAIRKELSLLNQSAVNSLDEGLEETLTLHRLRVFDHLGVSLKTTNAIESINSRLEH